jgi:putative redox protein
MVQIDLVYEGELHTTATHLPSQSQLGTDAPRDNEGRGESFSPTDLVATALGSCILTIMGIYAKRHNVSLEGARASVRKHMAQEPTRRIGSLEVVIYMPKEVPIQHRAPLERAAHACPVHKSLHPDISVPVSFVYEETTI